MESFGKRLNYALKAKKVKQKALAEIIGITPGAVSGYCNGFYTPSPRTIRDICNALNINENWLVNGVGDMERQTPESVTSMLAEEYSLEPYAAQLVSAFAHAVKVLSEDQIRALVKTIIAEMQEDTEKPIPTLIKLQRFCDPAAAGSPIWADSDFETVEFPIDEVPSKTDFAVLISGESMLPTIPNGATVFVQRTNDISNDDIIIAWIDGEGTVCKRAKLSGDRLIRLESDNNAYPDITGDVLNDVRIYGKVLGVSER